MYGGRGGSFSPARVSSMLMWQRSDQTDIVITGSGISSWPNKKGSASAAVQATDAARPTVVAAQQNGLPGVLCASQWLTGTLSLAAASELSVFVVAKLQNSVSNSRLLTFAATGAGDTSATGWVAALRNAAGQSMACNFSSATRGSVSVTYNTTFIFSSIINGAGVSNRINDGAEVTSAVAPSITVQRYGISNNLTSGGVGTTYWSNYIFEMIVLGMAAPTELRQHIVGYLAHDWDGGLVAALPADHPFKTAAP